MCGLRPGWPGGSLKRVAGARDERALARVQGPGCGRGRAQRVIGTPFLSSFPSSSSYPWVRAGHILPCLSPPRKTPTVHLAQKLALKRRGTIGGEGLAAVRVPVPPRALNVLGVEGRRVGGPQPLWVLKSLTVAVFLSVPSLISIVVVLVAQSCPTLCDPKDCSPPVSSVHGILQARILEWLAIPFSRVSS